MIITVGGAIGSGKSTLAENLAESLGLPHYSVGGIMRDLAEERGMSLLDFSAMAESDSKIDEELDRRQKDLCMKGDCVIDSRLGAYFLPADFRIWLEISSEEQAKRVSGRDGIPQENALDAISKRRESERKRYKEIYDIDLEDKSIYDLIVDTSELSKEQVLDACLAAIKSKESA